ncbi:MAG: hypothetical protein ABFD77_02070 [Thermotogota bacterium]
MDQYSRYRFCTMLGGNGEIAYLDEREPFRYRDEPDNTFYTAKDGDTWWGLAWKFFSGFPNKALLYFLLCEFQPEPVVDPTIRIEAGRQIAIPSERIIRTKVYSKDNRQFSH